jgi:hypothetical protein
MSNMWYRSLARDRFWASFKRAAYTRPDVYPSPGRVAECARRSHGRQREERQRKRGDERVRCTHVSGRWFTGLSAGCRKPGRLRSTR